MTIGSHAMLDGSTRFEGGRTTMQAVRRAGEPFTFGFDPNELRAYLDARGFDLEWDTEVATAAARYYGEKLPPVPAYYHVASARRS